MIPRTLAKALRRAARRFPVISLTGPRQSGKTTLVRATFPGHEYVSLELPDERAFALQDPRGFLKQFRKSVILDEVQRAPDLLSYIQVLVDEKDIPGRFVLTGSQNFLLLQGISQSLAGRGAVLHLLPFSLAELEGRPATAIAALGKAMRHAHEEPRRDLHEVLFTGFYPRIHDKALPPRTWLASYYQTYLERDVRNVFNVGDLEAFSRFIRLCAGRNAQFLNLSGLASDCGITHTTARRWISVLETSFVLYLLRPHHENFSKRLVKSPKLFFLDTGLLCFLLGVRSARDLESHPARGPVFESFVLSEIVKGFLHCGEPAPVYFWRDSSGHEVDFIVEAEKGLFPVEAKSGQTFASDFLDGMKYWRNLSGRSRASAALVYGGDKGMMREGIAVVPWHRL